ncbi:MAG TPA: protein phosphatase 2C domain-containing protein [Chloroflexota bacterium]|nr:protein phosphatase 2C domain-containing protein [Chloroflexota bacterium]
MLELVAGGLTDAGPHRATNEDSIGEFAPSDPLALQRKGYLYVVADGLGGHSAGEVASSSAVATLGEEYYSPSNHTRIEPALRQAVQAANLRIHELTHRNPEYRSMETTLSALAIAGSQAYIAHIGDTRIYHWRAGRLSQLTSDHSEAAELVRLRVLKPERVRDHPGRNVLTRTLGSRLIPRPDYLRHPVLPGDQFAMCSDGLWSEIEEIEMAQVLAEHAPARACRELIDRALARDCNDNVSIQVIRIEAIAGGAAEAGAARNGWLSGIFQLQRRKA